MRSHFAGMKGLEPTMPTGSIVTVGIKDRKSGNPVRTNRFFFVSSRLEQLEGRKGWGPRDVYHPLDERFAKFNSLEDNDPRARRLEGLIGAPEREDALVHHYLARKLPRISKGPAPLAGGSWEAPRNNAPACTGDGVTARRHFGDGEFREIPCANDLCQFRTMATPKACRAFAEIRFFPRWQRAGVFPEELVVWSTRGWRSAKNAVGLFRLIDESAEAHGLAPGGYHYMGCPFSMSVERKTKPELRQRFPVVKFAAGAIHDFLSWSAESRQGFLQASSQKALPAEGETDPNPEAVDRHLAGQMIALTPSNELPAQVAHPKNREELMIVSDPKADPDDPRAPLERVLETAYDRWGVTRGEAMGVLVYVFGGDPETREAEAMEALELKFEGKE